MITKIKSFAKDFHEEILTNRRYLHKNAEVGYNLDNTTKYVMEKLSEMGYEPKEISKSGVVATVGDPSKGKTFLIRGDMDALPMVEESDLDFKSTTCNTHACGHDFHTSMLLGAAKILKEIEGELEGCVKLMFQPAEELLSGAKTMIDAGVLTNPEVDAALAIHIFTGMPMELGAIALGDSGPSYASHDRFDITIQGRGCHGAMPSAGIDPLIAMSNIHLGIQALSSREVSSNENFIATVGCLSGGSAANVIPDTAKITGTIRAFNDEIREFCKDRIKDISTSIGSAYRCQVDVEYSASCPSLLNDKKLRDWSKESLGKAFPNEVVLASDYGVGQLQGSEDFAFISREVPSTAILLSAKPKDSNGYPMHHPKVHFDESILSKGAEIYAYSAYQWLKDHK